MLNEFNLLINRGSMPFYLMGIPVQKGIVGRQGRYKFVVNSDDHDPPHIHISLHDQQIAKYDLRTGGTIESKNSKLDKLFREWYARDDNRLKTNTEWERFHGFSEVAK